MGIELIFQWHKLLHFIMPIILIGMFYKRLGKIITIALVIVLGIIKEIRDILIYADPIWLCGTDTLFNIIGVIIGIQLQVKLNSLFKSSRAENI